MNDELKKEVQKSQATMQESHAKERSSFKKLLLSNPNYFGNLSTSEFKPVLSISGNTFYEELACVGYQPQQRCLEGVVYIYQPSGYGGDICSPGSREYVRFYLSFDSGVTWVGQGMTSFRAFDIPEGTQGGRLEYAVQLEANLRERVCTSDLLIRMRAILSWNNPPPRDEPNWTPVWGNVREKTILVEPRRRLVLSEIFAAAKIKLSDSLPALVSLDLPVETKTKDLSAVELATIYKDKGVPVHRFAFNEISNFISGQTSLSAEAFTQLLPGIEIDPDLIGKLFPVTDGDTSFEELKCIGLDPNSPDTLVGVIQVKKASGYSGGPCTSGSFEYVTFWADFDGSGSFETCLGTASVRVYDVTVPPDGVYYAVRLPVDLNAHRQSCKKGPKLVRIRAILSWNAAVLCSEPNKVPTWGNREETLINIAPGARTPAGKIAILGGIPVSLINSVTGLTKRDAVFATNNLPPDSAGRPCPFGGRVTVQGAPLLSHTYKVEVRPIGGGGPSAVVTDLVLTRQDGTIHVHSANPSTSRFNYVDFTENINGVLAQWDTTGDAQWEVKLTTFDATEAFVGEDTHLIQLDNTAPDASIEITTGTGDCGKFTIGTTLAGNFVARDDYLASYSLSVAPAVNASDIGVPNPPGGSVNTAAAPGNSWTLNTEHMRSCGYVIQVVATDLAIVNSQSGGHSRSDSSGFCLEEPGK